MGRFSMSDLGLLSYYLGIQVDQQVGITKLCQSSYTLKILEQAGMKGCNSCAVPMENRLKLSKNDKTPSVDKTKYRSIIGSMRYLVNTRPDIAYAVGIVSRYMEEPKASHWAAVKQILRYYQVQCTLAVFTRGRAQLNWLVSVIVIWLGM